ncbi:DnaJ like protein subfamily A member 2 [Angomonas deanei]|nr:DnaJ like protein subfamily A member 2 [Angomonas deanei]|eukprot:EPY35077.1 DnaJ like protein subfamily A member 2 [Angomonas deanei]
MYDQFGEKGAGMEGGGMDPTDIFASFFGGGGRSRGEPKPKDIVHELPVALEAFYCGKTVKLAILRDRLCTKCNGAGSKSGKDVKCLDCGGRGVRMVTRQLGPGFLQQMQVACTNCKGKGTAIKDDDKCDGCKGQQVTKDKKIFEVVIEKGMHRGDSIAFRGEGDQIPGVKLSGDIIIILDQKPHPVFTRKGNHLLMEKTISLAEALTGFKVNITHLDERKLTIQPSENLVTNPTMLYSVHREGMPVPHTGGVEKGDLVIKFSVVFPTTIEPSAAAELRKILGYPPQPTEEKDAEMCYYSRTTIDLDKESRSNAYADDDDEDPRGRGQTAQCAQQ